MWQELRDSAAYAFQASQSERDRMITVVQSALSNEAFMTDKNFSSQRAALFNMLNTAAGAATTDTGDIDYGNIDWSNIYRG